MGDPMSQSFSSGRWIPDGREIQPHTQVLSYALGDGKATYCRATICRTLAIEADVWAV